MNHWYVIQTRVNEEEKLVELIKKRIPPKRKLYADCFVPKYDNVWRLKGMCLVNTEIMFAGYVFVITSQPDELYIELKTIPKLSKLLGETDDSGEKYFVPLLKEEEEFMENILDMSDHIVHRSIVRRDKRGIIYQAKGALEHYLDNIVKVDFTHRRVLIDIELFGRIRRVKLCVMGEDDCREENIPIPEWGDKKEFTYEVGDVIMLASDAYEGQQFEIKKVDAKKRKVTVEIDMFGMPMELTVGEEEIMIPQTE